MSSQFSLLAQRRLLPLFMTQFLGAFNDNVMKSAIVILITFHGAELSSLHPGLLVNACAGLFILPFLLFSASAGQIADKYEKAGLIRLVKLLEIAIAAIATVGIWHMSLEAMLLALFLMGSHSALFGPLKYAILPQHLATSELVGGNALIESSTFIAILIGTLCGGLLISAGAPAIAGLACCAVALLGYLSSRFIPTAEAPAPQLRLNPNPLLETWRSLGEARRETALFAVMSAISWFWFYGAMFLSQIPAYTRDLGGGETLATLFLATFSLGIGIGSLLCERLARGRIEPALVPIGMLGLSLFAFDLYVASQGLATISDLASLTRSANGWRVLFDLVMIGASGGLYCVPLYALLQTRARITHRSRSIAATNIQNALFMVMAAVLAMLLLGQGLTAADLFLATALLNLVMFGWLHYRAPEFMQALRHWRRSA